MLTASTPGAPLFAWTFSYASQNEALRDLKRLHLRLRSHHAAPPACRVTSGRPWPARPLRSTPITEPSPLLRAGPPLCPASVLCPSRFPPLGVLPLAGRVADHAHLNGRIGIGTTGSPVPCQRLRRAHATYTPDTARPTRRPPPGSGHATAGAPSSRGYLTTPVSMPSFYSFDASAVVHTRSSSRRTPDPLTAGLLPQTLTTPALNRRSLRWFEFSACTAHPEGRPPSLAQHVLAGDLLHRHHSTFRTHEAVTPWPSTPGSQATTPRTSS